MDYEHYILQGEAKSTEFSDDRSYLLVQKANSYCACVGQTEECCLPKIDLIDDFGSLLYSCLDRCVQRIGGPMFRRYMEINVIYILKTPSSQTLTGCHLARWRNLDRRWRWWCRRWWRRSGWSGWWTCRRLCTPCTPTWSSTSSWIPPPPWSAAWHLGARTTYIYIYRK